MKGRYQSWGEFLKESRAKSFRSARDFCSKSGIETSYPQYSRYESGDQLPSLDQAIQICQILKVDPIEGVLQWCRAQIGSSKDDVLEQLDQLLSQNREGNLDSSGSYKQARQGNGGNSTRSTAQSSSVVSLDEVIVFNRSHLELFRSELAYRDIFTYVNSYAPEWIGEDEIATALDLNGERVHLMLERLRDLGIIHFDGQKCRSAKKVFYFPDDADFFELRNVNLTHNAASILKTLRHEDLLARRGYRGVVTRELTEAQVEAVILKIDRMTGELVDMPETAAPEKIYSLCVLLGERFSRSKSQPHPVEKPTALETDQRSPL